MFETVKLIQNAYLCLENIDILNCYYCDSILAHTRRPNLSEVWLYILKFNLNVGSDNRTLSLVFNNSPFLKNICFTSLKQITRGISV